MRFEKVMLYNWVQGLCHAFAQKIHAEMFRTSLGAC